MLVLLFDIKYQFKKKFVLVDIPGGQGISGMGIMQACTSMISSVQSPLSHSRTRVCSPTTQGLSSISVVHPLHSDQAVINGSEKKSIE